MKTKIFTLLFVSFLFLNSYAQSKIQTIDAKTYAEKLKTTKTPQLLDVRTPEEFKEGHIKNANNINWEGEDFVTKADKYNKTKPIFIYCQMGGRSAQAAFKLSEMGFKEIYNLQGGIEKWNTAELIKSPTK